MRCKFTWDDINEYADGSVSKERADMIKEHLNGCRTCSLYYDSILLSGSYMKESTGLKSDINKKVLESIDPHRYKGKKPQYRFFLMLKKNGWIIKSGVAIACIFLAVLVLRNEYVGSFISNRVTQMVEKKQQDPININKVDMEKNAFASKVLKGDSLLYKVDSKYYLVDRDGNEQKLELPANIWDYQTFASEDLNTVYYNTNFNGVMGRIMRYDVSSKKSYDLLDELGIELNGHISVFSYDKGRIIAVTGALVKDADGNETKLETNRLLEIELNKKSHRFIDLSFTPWSAASSRGIDFIGDNYLVCYWEDSIQRIVTVNRDGHLVRELPLSDPSGIVNIQVSPDNSMLLYQVGFSPVDLFLYDIEKDRKMTVFDSREKVEDAGYPICVFSGWSKSPDMVYYFIRRPVQAHAVKAVYIMERYAIEENNQEDAQVNTKDLKLLQMMFPDYKFEQIGKNIITHNYNNYLDFGVTSENNGPDIGESEMPVRYFVERVETGEFIKGAGEKSLIIARRDGQAHADGFYHAYAAVFDEAEMKLLSPIKHFFADEGKISVFKGKDTSYVFYAGSVTYQGWSNWTGGLWKLDKEWKSVWPEEENFWENRAVEINKDSVNVLDRKVKPESEGALPDYTWEFSYKLNWNEQKEIFEKE